jgi:2,3-dihydro-2,3-dihydroxybenzoate dehydrogenase
MPASAERVIVTGAASGIGAAVVELLRAEGARVCGWDLRDSARAVAGPFFRVDVTNEAQVAEALWATERELGPIDALVNVAGVLSQLELCSAEATLAELRRTFAVNTEAVWLVSRAVAQGMIERRRGAIVTVASNAATVPRLGLGAYCASKAAAVMLTRCLGLELSRHGVRCNVVSPGSTDTPMLHEMLGEAGHAPLVDGNSANFRLGIPLGRVASPRDVAEAVSFLLSDRARHITLQDLKVDGGATF